MASKRAEKLEGPLDGRLELSLALWTLLDLSFGPLDVLERTFVASGLLVCTLE
jgi:hypothetical protein